MGWLTKIFRGSSHKFLDGYHHRRRFDEDRSREEARHSADGSDFDQQEIDHAIALSLADQDLIAQDDPKGKKVCEYESDAEEDEEECLGAYEEEDEEEEEERQRIIAQLEEEEERQRIQAQLEEEERLRTKAQLEEEERQHIRAQIEEEKMKRAKAKEEEEKLERAKAQLEEDELLAKAIQESLNAENLPQRGDEDTFRPYPFFLPSGYRTCAGCHAEIGLGRFLSCMGGVWHPDCFLCHACKKPITDHEFSMSGNRPYHKACYKEHHHPKCDVCRNFIPTNSVGLIEYRAHPFWTQKYCPAHERDGTPRCCSCERMEPRDTKYLILDDGRRLCLECLDSSIMDTHECQPLYLEIREFYEGLHMKVEQEIPLLLVERQALNEAMEGEKQGHHHLPETRGLCLSEEQTVTTVLRRPRIGAGNRFIDMITEPYRVRRHCEVTAILILFGLPRLLTGSILAHEMMHAWLRLNEFHNLTPEVEEGICQVLAHMWIESEIYSGSGMDVPSSSSSSSSSTPGPSKKGKRSDFEKQLGGFFKYQIESDSSSAYGDGFRKGNAAVLKHGLKRTLDHIKLTGSFP